MYTSNRFFRQMRLAFGRTSHLNMPSLIKDVCSKTRTDTVQDEIDALTDAVGLPVIQQSEEELERNWYYSRGQKLVRQENWEQLGAEIRQFDEMRATTTAGSPIAEVLTRGARNDVVRPIELALRDRTSVPSTKGIAAYHAIQNDLNRDYGIALVLAHTHIDAGWAWHDFAPTKNSDAYFKTFRRHFKLAHALLSDFDPVAENAPALAAAQCALLPGLENPGLRVSEDYEDLIDLDPTTSRHIRNYGLHLLPAWFGNYEKLELQAQKTAERTSDMWGTGGYAWMYLDALTCDAQCFEKLDTDLFMSGLLDIFDRLGDQHTANLFSAFLALTLAQPAPGRESNISRRKRAKLHEAADWAIESHLREIHPLVWYEAAPRMMETEASIPTEIAYVRGEELALRILFDRKSMIPQASYRKSA